MNVVLLGASKFGLRCFRTLRETPSTKLVGVVTMARRFTISYRPSGVENVLHADLGAAASDHGLPVLSLSDGMMSGDLLSSVSDWRPDAFVVAGWYYKVPRCWREVAPAYGLHASLLPDYSGGAPLVWAMINDEKETGITLFQLDDGIDSGPIVAQRKTEIQQDDTIASLYSRIEELGAELLAECMPHLAAGTLQLRPQNESARRVFPQRSPEDGLIDWAKSTRQLYNFVRAQTSPYPGAFTLLDGKKLTIWSASEGNPSDPLSPGEALLQAGSLRVGAGDGALEVLDATLDGEPLTSPSVIARLAAGARLGN
jgi:methionyl-tRNA formyltransferase